MASLWHAASRLSGTIDFSLLPYEAKVVLTASAVVARFWGMSDGQHRDRYPLDSDLAFLAIRRIPWWWLMP